MRRAFFFILNINHKQFDDFTTEKTFQIRSLIAQAEDLAANQKNSTKPRSSRDRAQINLVQIHSYFPEKKISGFVEMYFSVLSCFSPLHIVFHKPEN